MTKRRNTWLAAIALAAAVTAHASLARAADVWVQFPWNAVTPQTKPPAEPPKSMTIIAARGGIGTGMVVVADAAPIRSLPATLTELKAAGGETLAKSAVQIRFPTRRRDCGPDIQAPPLEPGAQFDAISPTLIPGENVQPVLITVDVPASTAAGTYTATLSVAGKGVPVELKVGFFVMPSPEDRQLYVELVQSPDTLARRYNVPLWSDAHFALIEESLKLVGRLGGNIMHAPVLPGTYYGHDNGLIFLRRTGSTLSPDFTAFDRYLALWIKHCGKPRFVQVGLWEMYMRGRGKGAAAPATIELTLNVGGKFEKVQVPNPEAAKDEQPWKAIVTGVQDRLTKAGIDKRAMVIGQMNDSHSGEAAVEFYKKLDPELKWSTWTHGYGYKTAGHPFASAMQSEEGAIVGLARAPDTTPELAKGLGRWKPQEHFGLVYLNSLRSYILDDYARRAMIEWRLAPDVSADRHKQGAHTGYGPIGLDYFPLPPTAASKSKNWSSLWGGPYPGLRYARLDRGQPGEITIAGPRGVWPTLRSEALAEGAVEAEARLKLELLPKKSPELVAIAKARYAPGIIAWNKSDMSLLERTWNATLLDLYNAAGTAK